MSPHQNLPEGWVDAAIAAFATAIAGIGGWLAKTFLGRMDKVEARVTTLERVAALSDVRHTANIERLERIEASTDRINDKLDRLIERRGE